MTKDLTVPMFWDNKYLDEIKKRDFDKHIYEFYGSLPASPLGGMRSGASLPEVNREEMEKFVKKIHHLDIRFSYALNAPSMHNMEYTINGKNLIFDFLDWLESIKVDSLVITNPYLGEIVKENYSSFDICVSSVANVNSVQEARAWKDLGISHIKLPISANRNFPLIKSLSEDVKVDVELLVNQLCLYKCHLKRYHSDFISHDSLNINEDTNAQFLLDWCRLKCNLIRWTDLSEIIKSPIIRPEDMQLYREYGVKKFKIVGRGKWNWSSGKILNMLQAYANEEWKGNWLDFVDMTPPPVELMEFYSENEFHNLFSQPLCYIDNNLLEGAIKYFIDNGENCHLNCGSCKYCTELAKKVILVPSENRLQNYIRCLKLLDNKVKSLRQS